DNKISERVRGAIDRAVPAWPTSWEARIGHARVIERRRGAGEGVTEALKDLGAPLLPGRNDKPMDAMVAAWIAGTARRAQLLDVAGAADAELERTAPGSPLRAYVDARLHGRQGPAAVAAACKGGLRKADTDCLEAHRERGEFGAALAEIDRLRRLRDA